jgi:hypothetical protein
LYHNIGTKKPKILDLRIISFLTKQLMPDIHSIMFSGKYYGSSAGAEARARAAAIALVAWVCLASTGCVESTTPKHVTALANATAPVVDEATLTLHTAQSIHAASVDYQAAADFGKSGVFNQSNIQEWPTEKEVQIRLAVLAAFQVYVKDLEAINNGTDSPALDAASKSLGNDLSNISNSLAPTVENALGVTETPASTTTTTSTTTTGSTTTTTTSSSSVAAPLISAGAEAGFATAIDALGKFLISRTIDKGLPQQVEAMDKPVQTLCATLANEMKLIQDQEKTDTGTVIDRQTDFLLSGKLDDEERRTEFLKLPAIVRQQRVNDANFAALRAALLNLEMTHHALAAAVQGNNPQTFTQKLGDLAAAGESLGKFYSSIAPAQ